MKVRRRTLPPGWYPATADGVRREIAGFGIGSSVRGAAAPGAAAPGSSVRGAAAGVAPHAGWAFSGAIAAEVFAALAPEAETVVVVGGHLGRSHRAVVAREDAYETPFGAAEADRELERALESLVHLEPDEAADNTVEVQLPLARHFFPHARLLAMRAPPRAESFDLGRKLAEVARIVGRRVVVVGSTDLTHYGPNYDFMPRGTGRRALQWVRDENDARIVRAMEAMDVGAVVAAAEEGRAACSAGGALAAMGFASASGALTGELLRYATSYDVHPDDSFVGYAGIVYRLPP